MGTRIRHRPSRQRRASLLVDGTSDERSELAMPEPPGGITRSYGGWGQPYGGGGGGAFGDPVSAARRSRNSSREMSPRA